MPFKLNPRWSIPLTLNPYPGPGVHIAPPPAGPEQLPDANNDAAPEAHNLFMPAAPEAGASVEAGASAPVEPAPPQV